MKARFLASLGFAVALAVNACSSATAPVPPTSQPTTAGAAPVATPVAATDTAVPPSPTAIPTAVPTIAPTPTQVIVPTVAPTVAPTNTAAAQPAASGSGAVPSELRQTAEAMAAAKSYRMTVTITTPTQGQPGSFLMEVVKPDRLHMKVDLGGGKSFESILIGQDSYSNITGKWTKAQVPANVMSPVFLSSDPQKLFDQIGSSQKNGTLTKGGVSQVDGAPCQEWAWTPPTTSASQLGGTMCIGLKDSLPLQFKTGDGKVVAKYSDWNAPISIVAPI